MTKAFSYDFFEKPSQRTRIKPIQYYPAGLSPLCLLHTKAAGLLSRVVPIWLRWRERSSRRTGPQQVGARSLQCSSEVIDDVVVLVDFHDGLKLGLGDDAHGGRQPNAEMNLDAQVVLFARWK